MTLRRRAANYDESACVPSVVYDVLRSPGQPLDANTRTFMESRFGHDFGNVHVHADGRAAESARAVNALAYTVGSNIVFGSGQYVPGTHAGRKLIAHELSHVIQQNASSRGTSGHIQTRLAVNQPGDSYEQEADRAADRVLGTAPERIAHPPDAPATVQRKLVELSSSGLLQRDSRCSQSTEESVPSGDQITGFGPDPTALSDKGFFQVKALVPKLQGRPEGSEVQVHGFGPYGCSRAWGIANQILGKSGVKGPFKLVEHAVPPAGPGAQDNQPVVITVPAQQPATAPTPAAPPAAPAPPAKTPPYFGLTVAPDALKGITIYFKLTALPQSDFTDTSIIIKRPPYRIVPNQRRNPDGSSSLLFWNAYREEPGLIGPTGWDEWAIGPDSLQEFLNNIRGYAGGGAAGYMFGPPAPNAVEGARFVDAVLAGQFGEAGRAYGRSLYESIKDPNWWVQMLTAIAGAVRAPEIPIVPRGVPEIPPVEVPPAPAAAGARPALTVIPGGGGGGSTAVVGRVSGRYVTEGTSALKPAPAVTPAQPALRLAEPAPAPAAPAPAPIAPAAPAPAPSPLIPAPVAAAVGAALATTAAGKKPAQQPGVSPAPAPATAPAAQQKPRDPRKPEEYPLLWPVILPPPPRTQFVRVTGPTRDDELAEKLTAGKWIRARQEGLRGQELAPHHVIPLFLGGEDLPSNVILWNAELHRQGHSCLRQQPQVMTPPPPLAPLPADLLAHPAGIPYRLVDYKFC
jgi:hypothetical protein